MRSPRPAVIFLALLLLVNCGGGGNSGSGSDLPAPSPDAAAPPPTTTPEPPPEPVQPNIVLVLLDDAAMDTLDRNVLAEHFPTLDYLARQGLYIEDFYLTTPLCGPSRASILRGQFAHNTGIRTNAPPGEDAADDAPTGGFDEFLRRGYADMDLGTVMQAQGYKTYMVGKYHNNNFPGESAGVNYTPPSWDQFYGSLGDRYFQTSRTINGERRPIEPGVFRSDREISDAAALVDQHIATETAPFLLYLAPFNPHTSSKDPSYPPRHADLAQAAMAPRILNFNETDVSDKAGGIQQLPMLDEDALDYLYRNRLRSLAAIEDYLQTLLNALAAVADNTYLFITSDNGYHLGEHRTRNKQLPYQRVISVPMIVLGPGVKPGRNTRSMIANIDLLPTFVDLAGGELPDFVDGQSFAAALGGQGATPLRNSLLIENWGSASIGDRSTPFIKLPMEYAALQSPEFAYIVWSHGPREYYDLTNDPYQLENRFPDLEESTVAALDALLAKWRHCAGAVCAELGARPVPID